MTCRDFSYLKPPPLVNQLVHPDSYVKQVRDGKHIRRIFGNVPYDEFQNREILRLARLMKEKGIQNNYDDSQMLRFCYSGDFDMDKCLQKVKVYQQWMADPGIQVPTTNALAILEEGIFYSFGRDLQYRPVIVFNIAKMDLDKFAVEDFFCALNTLLKPIRQYMFVPGKVENWIWIIDTESKLSLPVSSASSVIQKLNAVFSSTLHRLFVMNSSTLISLMFSGVKRIIHPDTTAKIQVLTPSEHARLLNFVPADQLEEKYGGRVPNLRIYWPVKSTNRLLFQEQPQLARLVNQTQSRVVEQSYWSQDSKTEYFSITNDDDRFLDQTTNQSCCCSEDRCLLF